MTTETINIRLKKSISEWISFSFQFLCVIFLVRVVFLFETIIRLDVSVSQAFSALSGFFIYDIPLFSSIILLCTIPYLCFGLCSRKLARALEIALFVLSAIASIILTEYYCNMRTPLDQIIFAYSASDIAATVLSSATITISAILFAIVYIGIAVFVIVNKFKRQINIRKSAICLSCIALIAIVIPQRKMISLEFGFTNHSRYTIGVNQFSHFIVKIFEEENYVEADNAEIMFAARQYWSLFPQYSYVDYDYPFVRKYSNEDCLTPFFRQASDKPNFVFIIVESLGQKMTAPEKTQYSFTPFLDSLKMQSLYWENCLVSTERTFGVIPAIFSSVPQGAKGFGFEWIPSMPEHNSLLKDFRRNGYYTSFFYGGNQSFGNQQEYFQKNDLSYVMNVALDTTNVQYAEMEKHHRWGLDDAEMFEYAMNAKKDTIPFCDVYLTLSTHEPNKFPGIEKYISQIENSYSLGDDEEAEFIKSQLNICASFLYADECVKNLIRQYSLRSDFANTIFVITGDHRLGLDIFEYNPSRKYHVPLIIYSPLLTRTKTMKGVVSHYDITPSIESFLKNNYHFAVNSECHWIGSAFDTSAQFHCCKKQAFMHNNRVVSEWIHDTLFVAFNSLFSVSDGMELHEIQNPELLDKMQKELECYQILSKYSVNQEHLLPAKN